MKNQELFDKTVSILVKAYQNDTLAHSQCSACAVGNIILANHGSQPVRVADSNKFEWDFSAVSYAKSVSWFNVVVQGASPDDHVQRMLDRTGYSIEQLSKIEKSFELSDRGSTNDEWMFNGLMSVVDTLMLIHEATPQEAESAKLQFVKA